jgi:radical SAM protein with 4Fe4S-binding SPASM domain
VDTGNSRRIKELLERFEQEGLRQKIVVYFAPVEEYTEVYKDTCGSCMHMSDFARLDASLKRTLMEMGFSAPAPPRPRFSFCTADKTNSVVIGPDGELYACYTHIGDKRESIGTVFSGIGMSPTLLKWLGWDPLEKTDCAQCEVLPLCGGGCLVEGFKEDLTKKGACETYKFALDDYLLLYYDSRKGAVPAQQTVAGALPVEVTGGGSVLLTTNLKQSSEGPTPLTQPQGHPQSLPKLFQIQGRKAATLDQQKVRPSKSEGHHGPAGV